MRMVINVASAVPGSTAACAFAAARDVVPVRSSVVGARLPFAGVPAGRLPLGTPAAAGIAGNWRGMVGAGAAAGLVGYAATTATNRLPIPTNAVPTNAVKQTDKRHQTRTTGTTGTTGSRSWRPPA
jgi:hypothetical protein